MFDIRNVATSGFDRAIIAMRRENGGREASDSEWKEVHGLFDMTGIREFVIGPEDKKECLRLFKDGDYTFLNFAVVWLHLEADVRWWTVYGGSFIAASEVESRGDRVTKSVMTTYGRLHELMACTQPGKDEDWNSWAALRYELEKLPESWMIFSEMEG